tara:strand:- start:265 stop:981 length:717 start_codon:yes stop_codon:yes gene_type:complete
MDQEFKKIKGFFKSLTFDEPNHIYFVKGERIKSSVSKILKIFVGDTDFGKIAQSIDRRDNLPQGTTSTLWDLNSKISLSIGTRAHYFGEMYSFHRNLIPTSGYEEAIVKFWNDLPDHIVPAIMELQMYHKDYMFAGTGDILLYNTKTGKYIIGDYKTNKDLFKNHKGKKMLGPFSHLLDMALNHYQLQLSFYQILFEQVGLEVEGRKVIWVKPDGTYDMYDTEDYTKVLKEYLKNNKV